KSLRKNPRNAALVRQWLRMPRSILILMALLAAWILPPFAVTASSRDEASPAPSFSLLDLAGQRHSLDHFRGQVIVLSFWATWCGPCRKELPVLQSIQDQFSGRGVTVIGISVDDAKTARKVPRFVRKLRIRYPIWVGAARAEMEQSGLSEDLPAVLLINREGRIVDRIVGQRDEQARQGTLAGRVRRFGTHRLRCSRCELQIWSSGSQLSCMSGRSSLD